MKKLLATTALLAVFAWSFPAVAEETQSEEISVEQPADSEIGEPEESVDEQVDETPGEDPKDPPKCEANCGEPPKDPPHECKEPGGCGEEPPHECKEPGGCGEEPPAPPCEVNCGGEPPVPPTILTPLGGGSVSNANLCRAGTQRYDIPEDVEAVVGRHFKPHGPWIVVVGDHQTTIYDLYREGDPRLQLKVTDMLSDRPGEVCAKPRDEAAMLRLLSGN